MAVIAVKSMFFQSGVGHLLEVAVLYLLAVTILVLTALASDVAAENSSLGDLSSSDFVPTPQPTLTPEPPPNDTPTPEPTLTPEPPPPPPNDTPTRNQHPPRNQHLPRSPTLAATGHVTFSRMVLVVLTIAAHYAEM